MNLNKAYNCAELSSILDAHYVNERYETFDKVSSFSYLVNNSLSFIFEDKLDVHISPSDYFTEYMAAVKTTINKNSEKCFFQKSL